MNELGNRVRALREALELTQEQLGERFGQPNARVYLSKIENGHNKLTTTNARLGLARGFGLTLEQLDTYLDGRLTLDRACALARGTAPPQDEPQRSERVLEEPERAVDLEDGDDPFAVSLIWALDRDRHSMRDLDAVRSALRTTARMADPQADLIEAARAWLDAAARLRRAGKPVTIETLLLEITVGSKAGAVSSSAKALQEDVTQEWQERLEKSREKK